MTETQTVENQERKPKKNKDAFDIVWDNVKAMLIAVILAIIIKTSIVEAYKIPTSSMEDTLLVGDFLIANKFVYGARVPIFGWRLPALEKPQQGDVVIFKFPNDKMTNYIKRCVATGGQVVELRNNVLYVDDEIFPNPPHSKFVPPRGPVKMNFGPKLVSPNCYFMMGDNRNNSYDSREWGEVPKELILGKAMFIHWSWEGDKSSPDVSVRDPLSVPRLFLYNIVHFRERVRWERLFTVIR